MFPKSKLRLVSAFFALMGTALVAGARAQPDDHSNLPKWEGRMTPPQTGGDLDATLDLSSASRFTISDQVFSVSGVTRDASTMVFDIQRDGAVFHCSLKWQSGIGGYKGPCANDESGVKLGDLLIFPKQ